MRPEELPEPLLAAALAYWRRKRGDRAMPSRSDIDPAEMPALLPHLQLIDLVGTRYRYRLVGTALAEAFGRDYTGLFPADILDPPRAKAIVEVFDAVRATRAPLFLRSRYLSIKDVDFVANRLYLPLSQDGSTVNMILGTLLIDFGAAGPVAGAWGSARIAPNGFEIEPVAVGG